MVRIGFIRDARQCPKDFHKVSLRNAIGGAKGPEATVTSWPDDRDRQHYELMVEAPGGMHALDSWPGSMADILNRMGWTRWWLETDSLARLLGCPVSKALALWGERFWPQYVMECVILLEVGLDRSAIYQSAVNWETTLDGLRIDPEYDFEDHERADRKNKMRKRERIAQLWRKVKAK